MIDINEWQNYKGMGHKPTDFDSYWNKGLAELKLLSKEYTIEQIPLASHVASAYHVYFTGIDDACIHCQLVMPKKIQKKHKGLLLFHGYHVDSGDWQDKIGWAAEGFIVLAMDARGQGGLSEDTTRTAGGVLKGLVTRGIEEGKDNLYYRRVFLDTVLAAEFLMSLDFVDETEVYVQGASQGGGLALACAALVPRIKKAMVTYPFLSDYRKAYQLEAQTSAFEEIPYWFQFRDPLHKKEKIFFDTLEYIDIQHLVSKIDAEVCWIMSLQDTIVPPETQFASFNKIKSKKKLVTLPEYGHEFLPKVGDEYRSFFVNISEQ